MLSVIKEITRKPISYKNKTTPTKEFRGQGTNLLMIFIWIIFWNNRLIKTLVFSTCIFQNSLLKIMYIPAY